MHIHVKGDPFEHRIEYTVFDLIDDAKAKGFDVIAITMHDKHFDNDEGARYAESKGILLIKGIEKTIDGMHNLIYTDNPEVENLQDYEELREFRKNNDCLIVAPHPYYPIKSALKDNILINFSLYDAWEYAFIYTSFFNPYNNKLRTISGKHNKPIVGNSDVHDLDNLGRTFTLIDAGKDRKEIFKAIRDGRVLVRSTPLTVFELLRMIFWVVNSKIRFILGLEKEP